MIGIGFGSRARTALFIDGKRDHVWQGSPADFGGDRDRFRHLAIKFRVAALRIISEVLRLYRMRPKKSLHSRLRPQVNNRWLADLACSDKCLAKAEQLQAFAA